MALHSPLTSLTNLDLSDPKNRVKAVYRIVTSGKCMNVLHHGNTTYNCSCSSGIFSFDIITSSLQQQCQICNHPLSDHIDAQASSRG